MSDSVAGHAQQHLQIVFCYMKFDDIECMAAALAMQGGSPGIHCFGFEASDMKTNTCLMDVIVKNNLRPTHLVLFGAYWGLKRPNSAAPTPLMVASENLSAETTICVYTSHIPTYLESVALRKPGGANVEWYEGEVNDVGPCAFVAYYLQKLARENRTDEFDSFMGKYFGCSNPHWRIISTWCDDGFLNRVVSDEGMPESYKDAYTNYRHLISGIYDYPCQKVMSTFEKCQELFVNSIEFFDAVYRSGEASALL